MPENHYKTVNQILNILAIKYGFANFVKQEELFKEWESIVGSSIAKHCEPKCIEHSVLFVEVKNNFWKNIIETKKEEILNLIRKNLKDNQIKKIQFI
jgi:predicted nucleic acid-binding Zn ribbon protein